MYVCILCIYRLFLITSSCRYLLYYADALFWFCIINCNFIGIVKILNFSIWRIQSVWNFCDVQRYVQWLPTKQIPTQSQQIRHWHKAWNISKFSSQLWAYFTPSSGVFCCWLWPGNCLLLYSTININMLLHVGWCLFYSFRRRFVRINLISYSHFRKKEKKIRKT